MFVVDGDAGGDEIESTTTSVDVGELNGPWHSKL